MRDTERITLSMQRAEPLQKAFPRLGCGNRTRGALDERTPSRSSSLRTNSLTRAGDNPSCTAAFVKLLTNSA